MAIYHFSAKVISRAAGSSAVASAAYRSASRLRDERLDRHHDFSNKTGVVHSEVMLPDGAPEDLSDREKLWNEVEAAEKRIDAQLAREIEFAIPREMTKEQGIELAREFVRDEFVDRGMIADLNVHWDSRAMIEVEQRLERATTTLAARDGHDVGERDRRNAILRAARAGLVLSGEQRTAFDHVTDAGDLRSVVGYAGSGKSAMLGVAREAWESAGYSVHGLALSGIAAENLESGCGIASRTIASMEHQWGQDRELLDRQSVLVIDEAGMIGSRQLERVVGEAEKRGAKVVLIGDPEQLQAIEAGAAFRATAERHGAVEITEIRRQHEDWQRDATCELATGRTGDAIRSYHEHDMVHAAATREDARGYLIDRWDRDRKRDPSGSRIILTHTRQEVEALNDAARGRVRESGSLARDVAIETERGMRSFADGDRVMFLKNERALGVKNGTLGTIESVSRVRMAVQLDDGRSVAFDVKDYGQIDHGYAATIHKAQGMTVDRTYVLATPGMDSHTAYVALSRHRDRVELAYGQDDFSDQGKLVRALSRERGKDMASDYADAQADERAFAERRGITLRERVVEVVRAVPDKTREAFARIARSLAATVEPAAPVQDVGLAGRIANRVAVERHARAIDVILAGQHEGRSANPAMLDELAGARAALNGRRESAARDMEAAYKKDPSLARDAAAGNIRGAVQAMQLETELRTDPGRRADRFVERWNELRQGADHAYQAGDMSSQKALRGEMAAMVKSLQRDPQMESILAARKQELGIAFSSGRSLGAELAFNHGIDLGRGLGIGM